MRLGQSVMDGVATSLDDVLWLTTTSRPSLARVASVTRSKPSAFLVPLNIQQPLSRVRAKIPLCTARAGTTRDAHSLLDDTFRERCPCQINSGLDATDVQSCVRLTYPRKDTHSSLHDGDGLPRTCTRVISRQRCVVRNYRTTRTVAVSGLRTA